MSRANSVILVTPGQTNRAKNCGRSSASWGDCPSVGDPGNHPLLPVHLLGVSDIRVVECYWNGFGEELSQDEVALDPNTHCWEHMGPFHHVRISFRVNSSVLEETRGCYVLPSLAPRKIQTSHKIWAKMFLALKSVKTVLSDETANPLCVLVNDCMRSLVLNYPDCSLSNKLSSLQLLDIWWSSSLHTFALIHSFCMWHCVMESYPLFSNTFLMAVYVALCPMVLPRGSTQN